MLLMESRHFTFDCCFMRAHAAHKIEAEPNLKQHAVLEDNVLFCITCLVLPEQTASLTNSTAQLKQNLNVKRTRGRSSMAMESYD